MHGDLNIIQFVKTYKTKYYCNDYNQNIIN